MSLAQGPSANIRTGIETKWGNFIRSIDDWPKNRIKFSFCFASNRVGEYEQAIASRQIWSKLADKAEQRRDNDKTTGVSYSPSFLGQLRPYSYSSNARSFYQKITGGRYWYLYKNTYVQKVPEFLASDIKITEDNLQVT